MSDDHLTFSDFHLVVARSLAALGWEKQKVDAVTDTVCLAISAEYGGRAHYIPKKNGAIKAKIRDEFNGRNIIQLSMKYGVSCSTVRRFVAR